MLHRHFYSCTTLHKIQISPQCGLFVTLKVTLMSEIAGR